MARRGSTAGSDDVRSDAEEAVASQQSNDDDYAPSSKRARTFAGPLRTKRKAREALVDRESDDDYTATPPAPTAVTRVTPGSAHGLDDNGPRVAPVSNAADAAGEEDDEAAMDDAVNDNDNDDDIAKDTSLLQAAEVGVIESVLMVNFMTHRNTLVEFKPNANFVTGVNGAGKSAIMAAVIVCLGGKANVTSRGVSLKSFIRMGEAAASVMVGLRNRGSDAYRPDVYGDTIYIERTLRRDGTQTSSYSIKNEKKKVVSHKKEDVSLILDYMNIQIDNPMTVLSQDMARDFLKSSEPKKKYQYFLKGTQIDELLAQMRSINATYKETASITERKAKELYVKKQEVDALKERLRELQQICELRGQIDDLKLELYWAVVNEKERDHAAKAEQLERLESKVEPLETKLRQKEDVVVAAAARIEELAAKVIERTRGHEPHKQERAQIEAELKERQAERRQLANDARECERLIKDNDVEIKSSEEKIAQEQRRLKSNTGDKRSKMQEEMEKLTRTNEDIQSDLQQNFNRRQVTEDEIKAVTSASEEANERAQDLKRRLNDAERQLQAYRSQRENRLRFFGDNMPQALEAIRRTQFDKAVTGPLGMYIELTDPSWAWAVQTALGRELNSFVVHTQRDLHTLRQLLKKSHCDRSRVLLNTSNEGLARDIDSGQPDKNLLTVMRVLKFSSPVAQQAFIDQLKIEKSVLIPEFRPAQAYMRGNRDRNVQFAYTRDGTRLDVSPSGEVGVRSNPQQAHERTLFGDVEQSIRNVEHAREALTAQCQAAQAEHQNAQRELQTKQRMLRQLEQEASVKQRELNGMRARLDRLQTDLRSFDEFDNSTIALQALQDERDRILQTRELHRQTYRAQTDQIHAMEDRIRPLRNQLQEIEARAQAVEEEVAAARSEQEAAIQERVAAENAMRAARVKLDELREAIAQQKQVVADAERVVEDVMQRAHKAASDLGKPADRVATRRTPVELEKVLRRSEALLVQQQSTRGNPDEIEAQLHAKNEALKLQRSFVRTLDRFNNELKEVMAKRFAQIDVYRSSVAQRAGAIFRSSLAVRNYKGKLFFDHTNEELHLVLQSKRTTQLSGGERSYSMVALLLALWESMPNPFRMIDEFDVCMDEVNRRISLGLLLDAADAFRNRQFIIISPNSIANENIQHRSVHVVEVIKNVA